MQGAERSSCVSDLALLPCFRQLCRRVFRRDSPSWVWDSRRAVVCVGFWGGDRFPAISRSNASCSVCSPARSSCRRSRRRRRRGRTHSYSCAKRFRTPRCNWRKGFAVSRAQARRSAGRMARRWRAVVEKRARSWVRGLPGKTGVARSRSSSSCPATGARDHRSRMPARGAAHTRCDRAAARTCTTSTTVSNTPRGAWARCSDRGRAGSSARSARRLRKSTERLGRSCSRRARRVTAQRARRARPRLAENRLARARVQRSLPRMMQGLPPTRKRGLRAKTRPCSAV